MRTAFLWDNPSRSLLDDLVQDTYVKLWKGRRRLCDFAIQHPEAVLRYVRTVAYHVARDHIKYVGCRKRGDEKKRHVPPIDVDPGISEDQEEVLLLKEIDEHLKHCLTGPDEQRDRMIFWLYYRQGMSTKEIASLSRIGLTAKGVGSVIERSKRCLRQQILESRADSE